MTINMDSQRPPLRTHRSCLLALIAISFASLRCTSFLQPAVSRSVAPSQAKTWSPAAGESTPPVEGLPSLAISTKSLSDRVATPNAVLTLPELIALALENNPQTRGAYAQARAAAAGVGFARSAYYPYLELDASVSPQRQVVASGAFVFAQGAAGPTLNLSWLVLDWDGRSAQVDEAKYVLLATNYSQNATINDTALLVEQSYYQYVGAEALVDASVVTEQEAAKNLDAANARRHEGVATVADVLQAQTALSQARLVRQQAEGQAALAQGALASSLGLPANSPIHVQPMPQSLDVQGIGESVDRFFEEAQKQRPELARAKAMAMQARRHVDTIRAQGLPSLTLTASVGRAYFFDLHLGSVEIGAPPQDPAKPYGDSYVATLNLKIPLFGGFHDSYNLFQAEELANAAEAQALGAEQQILLQVWSSYQAVKTVEQQLVTASDLLKSARESQEVAAARYKTGVGSILDLLTAQAALAAARAQDVQARASWLLAMASLAHDTGSLGPLAGK
jgi:outer membrane protein